jgi:hypothetical protein
MWTTPWNLASLTTWASGNTLAAGNDMTQRYMSSPQQPPSVNVQRRSIQIGMGSPLVPGTYIVGVRDQTSGAPMSYRLVSRGIGAGDDPDGEPWALQVVDLPFGAEVTVSDLPPRDVAFFRVEVPDGLESFGVELDDLVGDTLMVVNRGHLGNSFAQSSQLASDGREGARRARLGPDYFYRYPPYTGAEPRTTTPPSSTAKSKPPGWEGMRTGRPAIDSGMTTGEGTPDTGDRISIPVPTAR